MAYHRFIVERSQCGNCDHADYYYNKKQFSPRSWANYSVVKIQIRCLDKKIGVNTVEFDVNGAFHLGNTFPVRCPYFVLAEDIFLNYVKIKFPKFFRQYLARTF